MSTLTAPAPTQTETLEEFATRVQEEVRRLAASQPDHKARCSNGSYSPYNNTWEPECIVGTAYFNLGISPEILDNRSLAAGVLAELFVSPGADVEEVVHSDTIGWLGQVQGWQDSSKTWSEAVQLADES